MRIAHTIHLIQMSSTSLDRPNLFRIGPYERLRREGLTATRSQVWSLLSFLESPINVAAALRHAGDYEVHIREQGPDYPYFTMAKVNDRYAAFGRSGTPAPLDIGDATKLESASVSVSTYVRHARQYFVGASDVDYTVRPTILYYGALALGRAIAAASTSEPPRRTHGLLMRTEDKVTALANGEFALLHDCLSTNFELYAPDSREGVDYPVDVVMAAIPYVREAMGQVGGADQEALTNSAVDDRGEVGTLTSVTNLRISTHVLAVEHLALFALSHWSRYRPIEWEERLRGEKDGWSYAYRTLMDLVAVDIPLLALNAITRENHRFGTYLGYRHYAP